MLPVARQETIALNMAQVFCYPSESVNVKEKEKELSLSPNFFYVNSVDSVAHIEFLPFFVQKLRYGFFLRTGHYSECFTHITHLILTANL